MSSAARTTWRYSQRGCWALLASQDTYGWLACGALVGASVCVVASWGLAAFVCAVVSEGCLLIALCLKAEVGAARLGIATRVFMREDRRRSIESQCLFDNLARIHRRAVDGASEHLGALNQAMLRIEEQHRENLMLEADQLGVQVLLDRLRRSERRTALHLLIDDLACGFQNLVDRRQLVAAGSSGFLLCC